MNILFIFISLCISNIYCDLKGNSRSGCTGHTYRCTNGNCIPSTSVCDGAVDCRDRSDETYALCHNYYVCPRYAFRCGYGACVDYKATCNGSQDCADGSDESLPKCFNSSSIVKVCKSLEFQCDSGQCIDELSMCDGRSDCIDGSDESITQCITFRCPKYGFQCAYGGCIDEKKKCDHKEDCKDGSDEDPEICSIQEASTTPKPIVKPPKWNFGGGCTLPEKPNNGDYKVISGCIEGGKCNQNDALNFSCDPGYVLSMEQKLLVCKHGNWDPQPPTCLKLCRGLHSHSLNLECRYGDKEVSCKEAMRPGTVLKAECKNTYHASDSNAEFKKTECLSDGNWHKKLYTCLPDCGKRFAVTPLIEGGIVVKPSEFPWHAGFYLKDGEIPEYKCGGTIIHPKAVLTAAHCVFDDNTNRLRNTNKMYVTVGKHWSKWNHKNDSLTEQIFRVSEIIKPIRYKGKSTLYEHDIAILNLDKSIEFSSAVMPICLDKGKKFLRMDQRSNAVGTVVASGPTRFGGPVSEELRGAKFPLMEYRRCVEISSNAGKPGIISFDKFCTDITKGLSLQPGDSGSGMTFPRFFGVEEEHYIYGIVSLWPSDRFTEITAFTNVTEHIQWIEDSINAIEKKWNKETSNTV